MFNRSIRRIAAATTALALAGVLSFGVANADQIYLQQSGNAPAGGDPNVLTNLGAFTIGVAGSTTLQNPLLVIVGVYNGVGTPSIDFSTSACTPACPLATVGTYGLVSNTATLTSGQDVWGQLGLTGGGSESFTNWSGADVTKGFTAPTTFTLYAFAIDTSLSSASPITVSESGAANGSFILGYGCQDGTSPTICANGDVAQSVFTNTGIVDGTVPEPGVLALFGAGLLGGALLIGRRRRDRQG